MIGMRGRSFLDLKNQRKKFSKNGRDRVESRRSPTTIANKINMNTEKNKVGILYIIANGMK
jgi:hypothetical protein